MERLRIELLNKRQRRLSLDTKSVAFKFLTHAQIIDVNIPSSLNPSVQEALQYVLQRSGYSLCPVSASVKVLFTRSLPAAHYRLGPIPLRSALQVLAGPAWQLTTDEVSRSVCFERQKVDVGIVRVTPGSSHQLEARP